MSHSAAVIWATATAQQAFEPLEPSGAALRLPSETAIQVTLFTTMSSSVPQKANSHSETAY